MAHRPEDDDWPEISERGFGLELLLCVVVVLALVLWLAVAGPETPL